MRGEGFGGVWEGREIREVNGYRDASASKKRIYDTTWFNTLQAPTPVGHMAVEEPKKNPLDEPGWANYRKPKNRCSISPFLEIMKDQPTNLHREVTLPPTIHKQIFVFRVVLLKTSYKHEIYFFDKGGIGYMYVYVWTLGILCEKSKYEFVYVI